MANSNKDIDKILQDIKKRKSVGDSSGASTDVFVPKNKIEKDKADAILASLTKDKTEDKINTELLQKIKEPLGVADIDIAKNLQNQGKIQNAVLPKTEDIKNLTEKPVLQNKAESVLSADLKQSKDDKEDKISKILSQAKSEQAKKRETETAKTTQEQTVLPPQTKKEEPIKSKNIFEKSKEVEDEDDILIPSVKHIDAEKIVDDKFVDFFTQSIIVPRQKEEEISIKRKKRSFFKKKYITDSLSLSISKEDIEKAENQSVEKKTSPKILKGQQQEKEDLQTFYKAEDKTSQSEKPSIYSQNLEKEDILPKNIQEIKQPENIIQDKKRSIFSRKTEKPADEYEIDDFSKQESGEKVVFTRSQSDSVQAKPLQQNKIFTESAPKINQDIKQALPLIEKSLGAEKPNFKIETEQAEKPSSKIFTQQTEIQQKETTHEYYHKEPTKQEPAKQAQISAEDIISNLKRPQAKPQPKAEVSDITAMFMPVQEDDTEKTIEKSLVAEKEKADIANIINQVTEQEKEPVFEEYTIDNEFSTNFISEDPVEILEELASFKSTLVIRVVLSVMCSVVLIYLNIGATMGFLPIPTFMSPVTQPVIFYLTSLVFYAVAIIGFLPTIIGGFVGLFKTSTSDSFVSLSAVICLLQLIIAAVNADKIQTESCTIFAGFLVVALGFNALGKLICTNTISRNLTLADAPDGINAGYVINDPDDVKRLARTLEEKNLQVLVSRKTGRISNFISGGFSAHRSEKRSKILAILTYIVTLVCFIISFVLSKDFMVSIFNAAGASVLMLPLSHTLISSVPSSLMQKSLKQVGALVNGWQGIYQISETTHVSFDAKHLFPRGSVVLHGIKTFEKERLDLAILYAASIAVEKCDNLKPVFLNIIENKTDILFPLESCEYKVGQGYIAWIEHNRVIMGNRNIMDEYNIELPPLSLETKYTSEGKKPIYLSVNGNLFGMFVMSYHPDASVKENLERLVNNGVNVILQSTDFNVDSQLLEIVYNLPQDTVQVLNQNETALLLNYTKYSETTEASMAHLDSLYSLAAGFYGADSAKTAASTCAVVQMISIVIGALLAVMFSISQTLPAIPIVSVLLLGFGWMGLCLMRAFAKKYY